MYGNTFSLFVFIKWKNYCNVLFNDNIKCVAVICFNEISSSLKRPFWNNRPSNMVSHSVRFLTFSCLFNILLKTLWKNCHLLVWIFEIYFKIYYFTKFYDLKHATTKIWKKVVFIDVFIRLFLKNLSKSYFFKYKFHKFTILNFLLQKWHLLQYNVKFETINFIIVLIRLFSKSLWTKFRFSI